MWLWLWLAVLRGLGDRLAANSPLLLLDVDVVHSIACVLCQPCCISLAGVRDAVPTIAEIVWPWIDGQDQQEDTMLDGGAGSGGLDGLDGFDGLDALGLDGLDGLDALGLDDDDIGL